MLDQFIGQTLSDKYRIEEAIRENGSGKLYRATHLLMEKPVAVKILPPETAADDEIIKQFSAEARTVSRLSHPNILNVTDFGTDKNGAVFTVFENAEGETLKESLEREGKFSFERAVRIVQQIAAALSAAHNNGVIHSHLNAENILLTRATRGAEIVKILGFGSIENDGRNNAFDENSVKNFEYLAPEQNSSVSAADERSDVYSLGVIFYEMLTGELPFAAENPTELEKKQAENPPAPISAFRNDLPDGIGFIALKALSRNPEIRYQSVSEFSDDLSRVARNFGETETIVIPRTSDNTKNNLWKTAFVVLAGISLLAIGLIYATSVKQTNVQTQLQTDANGQPVQPLNPATGMSEQGLSNMLPAASGTTGNVADMNVPQPVPGGDGYGDGLNPWARGGVPPAGAPPQYIPPGGQMIDPNNPNSIFMQDGTVLVPIPTNTNANVKPSPTPGGKVSPTPAVNTQPSPTPKDNKQTPPPDTKPTPTPKTEKTPVAKPAEKPKPSPPAATEKQKPSGKEQES
ncbi:MAG: protein kinase [Acidobacteria bacterium]|nr:protein kinase [Acidobacteriota bacterium]MCA1639615.1 protein kinase [Acidobacteriota bacterium]